ncbi:MAG TPA: hypothetical protein VHC71_06400 [Hyphomicrobium sp.]|nr:hypothetical protein [Hyphomicrobium sp.]
MMKNPAIVRDVVHFGGKIRRWLRVIAALLRKEEEVRREAPVLSILELIEPLFLIASLMVFRFTFERSGSPMAFVAPLGGSILLYYATGFIPKYFFISISFKRISQAVAPNRRRFPVENRLDDLIVHLIFRLIDYTILAFLVLGTMYLCGMKEAFPHDFKPIVPALAAIAALGFGWGLLNQVLRRAIWFWYFVSIALNRAMLLMSGCLFLPDLLSPEIRWWISWNPEMHAIALFRTAFYPQYPRLLLDTSYMAYCAIFALLFGLALERVTRRYQV